MSLVGTPPVVAVPADGITGVGAGGIAVRSADTAVCFTTTAAAAAVLPHPSSAVQSMLLLLAVSGDSFLVTTPLTDELMLAALWHMNNTSWPAFVARTPADARISGR
jgi:hypothetical protein